MTFHIWRLSEASDDNLGLACTADALILGRTPLIARRDESFVVRERSEIERLLRRAYEADPPIEQTMSGLATVARALNANDQCLARIAAVHLRLPNLPHRAARDAMEAEDRLIRYARDEGGGAEWDPAEHPRTGTSPNPGWFAPKPGDSSPVHTADNSGRTRASDAVPSPAGDWVRLPPGDYIDELHDFLEWLANARPEDENAIRAEIKRYYYDVGDIQGGDALNRALSNILDPGFDPKVHPDLDKEWRQTVLNGIAAYAEADPAEMGSLQGSLPAFVLPFPGIATGAIETVPQIAQEGAVAESATADRTGTEASAAGVEAQAPSKVWTYGWSRRGNAIHEHFSNGSLPPLFRTIDNFTDGVATSFKSIDLNAATYQKTVQLGYRINTYVDTLGNYEGGSLSTTQVEASDIKDRVLNIIVPRGSVTDEMNATIDVARNRAIRANKYPVKIIVTEF